MSIKETLETKYVISGAEEVMRVNREVWKSYKDLGTVNKELAKDMLETNRGLLRARRAWMMMRTEIRVTHAAVFELMRGLRTIGAMGRTITSMWQAYTIAQIRVTQATTRLHAAQSSVVVIQDELNRLQQQGLTTGQEYLDVQLRLNQAKVRAKEASQALAKAQQDNIIGYIGMGLQVGTLITQMWMLYYRYLILKGAHVKEVGWLVAEAAAHAKLTIAIAIGTAVEWARVAAKKARAVASAIVIGIESLGAALPIIAIAAAAAAAIATGALAAVPSRQYGGYIPETGIYRLHAGEFVVPRQASSITINIYGARAPEETAEAVVDALRRRGAI